MSFFNGRKLRHAKRNTKLITKVDVTDEKWFSLLYINHDESILAAVAVFVAADNIAIVSSNSTISLYIKIEPVTVECLYVIVVVA